MTIVLSKNPMRGYSLTRMLPSLLNYLLNNLLILQENWLIAAFRTLSFGLIPLPLLQALILMPTFIHSFTQPTSVYSIRCGKQGSSTQDTFNPEGAIPVLPMNQGTRRAEFCVIRLSSKVRMNFFKLSLAYMDTLGLR